MRNIILISMSTLVLQACVNMPKFDNMFNSASSGTSQFDGIKHIRMSNMSCGSIAFELYQDTTKSKEGIALLRAGSNTITNIGNGKSLHFKLDGKVYSFESHDSLTEHDTKHFGYGVTSQFSHKSYVVPEEFIRKAAKSKAFLAKVQLLNNTYIEGKCSPYTLQEFKEAAKQYHSLEVTQEHVDAGNKNLAYIGFREFVHMMDSTAW